MKSKTTQSLQGIYQLLRNKKFEEVIALLEGIDFESLTDEKRASACLLYSEANLYLGKYDFEERLRFALLFYKRSNDNERFARAKFLYGWLLTSLGRHFDAKEALLESYAAYKRCDLAADQARVLNRLSFISFQIGDVDAAVKQLEQCISLFKELGEHTHSILISMNLALLYYSLGRLSDSIQLYGQICDNIMNQGPKNCSIYLCQSAIAYAQKGEFDSAKQNLTKARKYLSGFTREQAIYYENLGWIHLLEGDYREAEKALQKGLKISLEIAPESALVSQMKRRLADAYFGIGENTIARRYADEALVVAQRISERVEIAACYRVYAQLDCREDDQDSARIWFGKAFAMFTMIGSTYELAVTRYLAAMSGLYLNGERQALLYMAREYFESEHVKHYVEKINFEIGRVRTIPLVRPPGDNSQPPEIVTVNPEMKRMVELAQHIAPSKMSVLITGPTGSGKDLFARFIHYHSGRSGKFVPVNTAAIPENMIEAELFGFRKGAFTGADKTTPGWIEEAEGGTLYLNEIADATPGFQAKLLDVIERHRFCRLGERQERRIDFRVIAATNHDIDNLIHEGKFRSDLYHRLNEIPINLPPLSERRGDIPALIKYFLSLSGVSTANEISGESINCLGEILESYDWPGNVRELKTRVDRLFLLSNGVINRMIELAGERVQSERDQLLALLEETRWNRTKVARILGISEGAVRHRIKKYGLNVADDS